MHAMKQFSCPWLPWNSIECTCATFSVALVMKVVRFPQKFFIKEKKVTSYESNQPGTRWITTITTLQNQKYLEFG